MAKRSYAKIKEALTARRREMASNVRERIKEGRHDQAGGAQDSGDQSDANFQQAIDMTLLQMRAATVAGIDDALARIDAGSFGTCIECEGPIAEGRLLALPFAKRCRTCEDERETSAPSRNRLPRGATPFAHVIS
jgi:DnaK suppressor protein